MEEKRQVQITDLLPENFDDLVRKHLKKHIDEIDVAITRRGGPWALKSSPIVQLARKELLDTDYIFEETKHVLDKTSKHPSAIRKAIADIYDFAFVKAIQEAFKDSKSNPDPTPPQHDNDGMPPIPEDILDDLAKREAEKQIEKKYGQRDEQKTK
jgi:hypothetical protein